MNNPENDGAAVQPLKRQLYWGGAVLALGNLSAPVVIPLVLGSELPAGWKAAISGFMVLGLPEISIIVAVAIMGKEGFAWMKARFFAFLKREAPLARVSPGRYRLGLILFVLILLCAFLEPYLFHYIPGFMDNRTLFFLSGDLLLLLSLVILGGEFWDKLRALFIYDAPLPVPEKEGGKDAEKI